MPVRLGKAGHCFDTSLLDRSPPPGCALAIMGSYDGLAKGSTDTSWSFPEYLSEPLVFLSCWQGQGLAEVWSLGDSRATSFFLPTSHLLW